MGERTASETRGKAGPAADSFRRTLVRSFTAFSHAAENMCRSGVPPKYIARHRSSYIWGGGGFGNEQTRSPFSNWLPITGTTTGRRPARPPASR